jgi:hypothetical protein
MRYRIPNGLTVRCFPKRVVGMGGKEIVFRYDGLVDMEKIRIRFEPDETRIGAAVVGRTGTIRAITS